MNRILIGYSARMGRMRAGTLILLLVAASLAAIAGSLALGSSGIDSPWERLAAGDPLMQTIVWELRLPRALAAFGTGIVLALAGVLMQALLRNPLADPYVLGVSGGAAVGALGLMLVGATGLVVDVGAALGAFGAMLLVFAVAHGTGGWTTTRLLLTGVVVAAGCGAIVSLLLSLSDDLRLRGMLFWLLGDFGYVQTPWWLLALAIAAIPACLLAARPLDALARGELQARLLGVPVRGLRIAIYVAASLLTAAAVTTAGSIGFVGLVTPHMVRLVVGSSHRAVIPAAALAGGTLLVVADLAARTIVAPRILPVGALTALIGVPLFLFLMRRNPNPPGR
jgi:iron complex transport system permease protein